MLTNQSGEIKDSRRAMHKDSNLRERYLSRLQQTPEFEGGVHSPFIIYIPPQSRFSTADSTHVFERELGGLNVELEESLPGGRSPKSIKKPFRGSLYTSFPAGITPRIAFNSVRSSGIKSTKVGKDALEAIIEATDQYFGQLSNDLVVFANHAGRKRIEENDVIAVMRRYVAHRIAHLETTTLRLTRKADSGKCPRQRHISRWPKSIYRES